MLKINNERFLDMMTAQATIGGTPEGGLSRPALSSTDQEVRNWFETRIRENNLEYAQDGAGNQTATLRSANDDAKTVVIGSHLDSVPNGGRFDGALGVIAAFEALLTIKDAKIELPFHLTVINFTDEEGTNRGLLGSSAFTGLLKQGELDNPRMGRDYFESGANMLGISEQTFFDAAINPYDLMGYIEVHIEQGTRLESQNLDIGVVTSIVGIRSYWLTFIGEAAHSGTSPMSGRKDAFLGASDFAHQARQLVMEKFTPGTANFGSVESQPGAFNIVPAQCQLALEFRHGDDTSFDAMNEELLALAQEVADTWGLRLRIKPSDYVRPAPMADTMIAAVESACSALSLSSTRLMSFAGHDAQAMAQITPSVMYFVPSVDGISHNPKEYTLDEDCINAANVMLQTVLQLAQA